VIYTRSVAAPDTFLTLAKNAGGGDPVDQPSTVQHATDPANPRWDNDAAMRLYKQVMARYLPNGRVTDGLNFYGMAVAHAFTQLMYKAGRNPTRAGLMRAFRNWNEANPFLLPGNRQKTSGNDQWPVQCEWVAKFSNGTFTPVSRLKCDTSGT
jgi:branched-chain amino acid transport system substrate-binding protein